MIIPAKFASTCEHCGQPIGAGDLIDYVRGQPVNHAKCPTDAAAVGRRGRQLNDAYRARKRARS